MIEFYFKLKPNFSQMWCEAVSKTLDLMTSLSDNDLSKLLPVTYKSLTVLARRHVTSSMTSCTTSYTELTTQEERLDAAFQKWLLRVGDLYDVSA